MRRLHLLFSLNFILAPFEETRVPRGCTWYATCEVQKPWYMAQGSQDSHVVMNAFDRWVFDASLQVIELFAKTDRSHDVET
jgi:hypothetical protein